MVRSWTGDAFPGSKRTVVLSFLWHRLPHPSISAAGSVDPRPPFLRGAQELRMSPQPQGGKGIPGPQRERCVRGRRRVPSARRVDRGPNRLEESAGAGTTVGAPFPHLPSANHTWVEQGSSRDPC